MALEPLEQRQLLNADPVAHAGGPYTLAQNAPLFLDAALSYDNDPGDTLTYAWDLDQDGEYDDAADFNPVVPWATLVSLGLDTGTHSISVQVTDNWGASNIATTTLTISDRLSLVKDIHTSTGLGSGPASLMVVGDTLFFRATDAYHGAELWKSDLDGSHVSLVKDIQPGLNDSGPTQLMNIGGTLYFQANDGVNGSELWKSDGTSSGTILVKDIRSGASGSLPFYPSLTNVGGTLYFQANDGVNGYELWKSDGTSSGTVLVKDIRPGASGSLPFYPSLTNVGGTLYFSAFNGTNGYELWKSNGTSSGTVLVKDIRPGGISSHPRRTTNVGGTLFFSAHDGVNGYELWKSDGTSGGTVLVKDIRPGALSGAAGEMTNVGGTLYFTADDGTNGRELWKSNGTSGGTVLVKDIRPGANGSLPSQLVNVGGTLFFSAHDGVNGYELWKSDGTSSGTALVRDIRLGSNGSIPFNQTTTELTNELTDVGGTLYFRAHDGVNGYELWKSDGTSSGTVLVKDILPGLGPTSILSAPRYLTNVGGELYFQANDGVNGAELWKSDGTSSGTVLVKDILPGPNRSTFYLTNVQGDLYFQANDGVNGLELWKRDGITGETALLKDIRPGSNGSRPTTFASALTNVEGTLYFTANDGIHGYELWKSDGTSSGTVLVKDIQSGSNGSNPTQLLNVGGTLYFQANDGVNGVELWKSDGTSSGTVLVKDIRPGVGSSSASWLTNVGGTLYFQANDGVNGYELWKSDGTSSGTALVKDILPGSAASNPAWLTDVGGILYFQVRGDILFSLPEQLWKSDGTSSGTVLVRSFPTLFSTDANNVSELTNVGGTLYFRANEDSNGLELWKSNGTSSGSVMVKDIRPGTSSSNPTQLTNVGGILHFRATDGVNGYELWKSDGTSSGTALVKDIWPGSAASNPGLLTNIGGTLYFTADDGVNGIKLWKSDGTSSGTVRVFDVSPTGASSAPGEFLAIGDHLYFNASDLYAYDISPNQPPLAHAGGPYEIYEGESLTLFGAALDPDGVDEPLTYSWDVNGDGVFGDATGDSPTLSWAELVALGIDHDPVTYNVRLRVSDEDGGVTTSDPVLLTVQNAAPYVSLTGPQDVLLGESNSYEFSATDFSPTDLAAGFNYHIDWNGDGIVDQVVSGPSSTIVAHTFDQPGPARVRVSAVDRDNGVSASVSLKVSVAGATTRPNPTDPSLTDLVWGGSSGADHLVFEQVDATTIRVRQTRHNGQSTSNEQTFSDITGYFVALGGDGDDVLNAVALTTTRAILDGGPGNNTLYGGQGDDILIGGSNGGEGQQGNNVIVGGDGNNTIYGNAIIGAEGSTGGNNLIVSGSDTDIIYGNYATVVNKNGAASSGGKGGQNLIIGGGGADTIYPSVSTDGAEGGKGSILITGSTSLNQSALSSILSEWTSTRDYATKIANISGTGSGPRNNGNNFLQPGVTIHDDAVTDTVFSDTNGDDNWLLYALSTDVAMRIKPTEVSTYLD